MRNVLTLAGLLSACIATSVQEELDKRIEENITELVNVVGKLEELQNKKVDVQRKIRELFAAKRLYGLNIPSTEQSIMQRETLKEPQPNPQALDWVQGEQTDFKWNEITQGEHNDLMRVISHVDKPLEQLQVASDYFETNHNVSPTLRKKLVTDFKSAIKTSLERELKILTLRLKRLSLTRVSFQTVMDDCKKASDQVCLQAFGKKMDQLDKEQAEVEKKMKENEENLKKQ
jgi:hypothetical protein